MPVMGSCCAVNFTGKKLQKTKTTKEKVINIVTQYKEDRARKKNISYVQYLPLDTTLFKKTIFDIVKDNNKITIHDPYSSNEQILTETFSNVDHIIPRAKLAGDNRDDRLTNPVADRASNYLLVNSDQNSKRADGPLPKEFTSEKLKTYLNDMMQVSNKLKEQGTPSIDKLPLNKQYNNLVSYYSVLYYPVTVLDKIKKELKSEHRNPKDIVTPEIEGKIAQFKETLPPVDPYHKQIINKGIQNDKKAKNLVINHIGRNGEVIEEGPQTPIPDEDGTFSWRPVSTIAIVALPFLRLTRRNMLHQRKPKVKLNLFA